MIRSIRHPLNSFWMCEAINWNTTFRTILTLRDGGWGGLKNEIVVRETCSWLLVPGLADQWTCSTSQQWALETDFILARWHVIITGKWTCFWKKSVKLKLNVSGCELHNGGKKLNQHHFFFFKGKCQRRRITLTWWGACKTSFSNSRTLKCDFKKSKRIYLSQALGGVKVMLNNLEQQTFYVSLWIIRFSEGFCGARTASGSTYCSWDADTWDSGREM